MSIPFCIVAFLNLLCSYHSVLEILYAMQDFASLALKECIEEEACDLSGEAFSYLMGKLYNRIYTLLESNDVAENLGALRIIDELIDVGIWENALKISNFSCYMRRVFEAKHNPVILVLASKVLGHLARSGGAIIADDMEHQVFFILL